MTKTYLYNRKREVRRRYPDWRMGLISEEAGIMINLVEREPLGSGGGSGETSSILRDGITMLIELLPLSMNQT